jgi:starch synthase
MKILFASSEAHPLIKTGGLADVSASLPRALKDLGQDIRLVIPAYRSILREFPAFESVTTLALPGTAHTVRILAGHLPETGVITYLVDSPEHFDRDGNPYVGEDGQPWPDNAARFATLCRSIAELADDHAGLGWRPAVVHCNDWQTGLVPPLLAGRPSAPATVFTIHNLAYQGLFDRLTFDTLGLPAEWWNVDRLEFHNQFSFIKGGLVHADWLTTVSPNYAQEIRTPAFGAGLEGLLNYRGDRLLGILNGVDYDEWDPAHDPQIARNYTAKSLRLKVENKETLQRRFGLLRSREVPLIGFVGRLVHQKGIDLLLDIAPQLMQRNLQLAVLGGGDRTLEKALLVASRAHPGRFGVSIGYDEALSHQIEAGTDAFLMPSRFEPCGLNQIYSLRYGTVPIVRNTGGLADTVVDATDRTLRNRTATGFKFDGEEPRDLLNAVDRALRLYQDRAGWRAMMQAGMKMDFSWGRSALEYLELYRRAVSLHGTIAEAVPVPSAG